MQRSVHTSLFRARGTVRLQSFSGLRYFTHSARYFQIERSDPPVDLPVAAPDVDSASSSSNSQLPWYLRENTSSPQEAAPPVELPAVPQDSPKALKKMVELMGLEYGLENVQLFDLTVLHDDHPFSSKNHQAQYVLIGSGKSGKHIQKAANEMRGYIKHTHGIIPPIEGLVSSLLSPVERRRLLRRARKGPMATDNDYGRLPNSWVMFDTGVDGIHVHMMTPQRRRELQLEAMYSPDYDPNAELEYDDNDAFLSNSDSIFIGTKRGFHSMTAFARARRELHQSLSGQSSILSTAQDGSNLNTSSKRIQENIDSKPQSHDDFIAKFDLCKSIHMVNPKAVTLDDAERILVEKNASWANVFSQDCDPDIHVKNDIVRYMKLLIDSPEISALSQSHTVGEQADELMDRVSRFMNKILRFTNPQVDMLLHPEFVVLLWRLILRQEKDTYVSVATVDAAIADGELPDVSGIVSLLASNRARDLIFLSAQYAEEHGVDLSREYQELVLFAYGNDNNWTEFWETWERYFGMRAGETPDSSGLVTKWVRLATYLAIRGDQRAAARFFGVHWHRSKSIGVTFLHDFEIAGSEFASATHCQAFIRAVERLLLVISEKDDAKFAYVRRTLKALESQASA